MSGHPALYALIVLMVVFWSGNFIVGKIALREIPPLLLCGLRIGIAAVLMIPVYWWEGRHAAGEERWTRAEIPALVWLGLFGVALNQFFFVLGLSRTSVAHSAIIIGMGPMLVLVLASFIGLETFTARKAAGMCISLAGVTALKLFEPAVERGGGPTWLGDFLTFLAALTFALFTVFGKRLTLQHSSVTVNTFAYVAGALALAPVTLWQAARFSLAQISLVGWLAVLYMALFPSVICYLIYYYALTHIQASRVSAFSYLQPLLATVMGVALLGERLTGSVVAGGAVIFAGVYLAERG